MSAEFSCSLSRCFFLQNVKSKHEAMLKKYNDGLLEYHRKLVDNIKHTCDIKCVTDENSKRMEENIQVLKDELTFIHENFFDVYSCCIESDYDSISTIIIEISYKLPIALAGRSNFAYMSENGNPTVFTVVLSVLPDNDKTYLIFSCKSEDTTNLIAIIKDFNDLTILGFIESWMIYGTDYWLISPDYWDNLSEQLKNRVLEDLLIKENYPTKELEYSIFSDIRKKKIIEFKESLQKNEDIELQKEITMIIEKEEKKLQFNDGFETEI